MRKDEATLSAWAKLKRDETDAVQLWRSLVDHCLDVAAVFRTFVKNPVNSSRLASLGGLRTLEQAHLARMAVAAGLHDIGKANRGFQNRATPGKYPVAGHVGEMLAILNGASTPEARRIIEAARLQHLVTWFEAGEQGLIDFLFGTLCHHGRTVAPPPFRRELWAQEGGLDPGRSVEEVVNALLEAHPDSKDGSPLPSPPPLVHAFMGLVTLSDWIASDTRHFSLLPVPGRERSETLRLGTATKVLGRLGLCAPRPELSFEDNREDLFRAVGLPAGAKPRPTQRALGELALPKDGGLVILEAETGSGKTEAALVYFMRLYQAALVDGLYFALPTRAAARQIHLRVQRFAERAFGNRCPPVILAVPGYLASNGLDSPTLSSSAELWNEEAPNPLWAAEHRKRYLAGRLVVGTVDQVLLSALQANHSHMRAAALLRHLLVIDEVHASDNYMTPILQTLIARQLRAGGHVLLLSATLGEAARSRFLSPTGAGIPLEIRRAEQAPYPCVWSWKRRSRATESRIVDRHHVSRQVGVRLEPRMVDADQVARMALQAARTGARVGIIRNTVQGAVSVQRALECIEGEQGLLFRCRGKSAPHHARFSRSDRLLLDASLEEQLQRDEPVIVCATQTIEQSLDIDLDFLLTDLCPMDVLIQRVGRLHRHQRRRPPAFQEPQVIVLAPESSLDEMLDRGGKVRGPGGLGTVYWDLCVMQATLELLKTRHTLHLPDDSRHLIEQTTHPGALDSLATRLGAAWLEHRSNSWGRALYEQGAARGLLVDWDRPLRETYFSDLPETVKTRLGERDRLMVFPSDPLGPFGEVVEALTLPGYMLRGHPEPEEPVLVEEKPDEGFVFRVGQRLFTYDRLGVRASQEGPPQIYQENELEVTRDDESA